MSKKVYAVADEVPERRRYYLTAGKMYPVKHETNSRFSIEDDLGRTLDLFWHGSEHLNGNDWRRVETVGVAPPDHEAQRIMSKLERELDAIRDVIPARYLHPTKLQAPLSTLDAVRRMVEELEAVSGGNETLRDECAKEAMGAIISGRSPGSGFAPMPVAKIAYDFADAMLEARRKK